MAELLFNAILGVAALVAILDYFGIRPGKPVWGIRMPLSSRWKIWIMLCLVITNLGISAHEIYAKYSQRKNYGEWLNSAKYLEQVNQQNFNNESVAVDGKNFQSCVFTNVTLVYKGEKGFTVGNSKFVGQTVVEVPNGPSSGWPFLIKMLIDDCEREGSRCDLRDALSIKFVKPVE